MRAEACEGLRELAADRPAAQHDEAPRQLAQLPYGVGGQRFRALDAGDRRDDRPGAGRDDDGARAERAAADLDGPWRRDASFALDALDAKPRIALDRIVRLDGAHDALHPLHHLGEVEIHRRRPQAVIGRAAHLHHDASRLEQGLRGHAAGVEAVAAHPVLLDQRHLGAHRGGDVGGDQARRAAADHHQVAVEARRPLPARVNAPRLEGVQDLLRDEREDAEQHEGADDARRKDARGRVDGGELSARVRIDERPRQHAELAHPVEGQGAHRREAHHEVDEEVRHRRDEPQREEVKRAFLLHAAIDALERCAVAAAHPVAQHEARYEESDGRAERCGERHEKRAHAETEDRAGDEGEHRGAGDREAGHRDIEEKEARRGLQRMRPVPALERRLLRLDVLEGEIPLRTDGEERHDGGQHDEKNEEALAARASHSGRRRRTNPVPRCSRSNGRAPRSGCPRRRGRRDQQAAAWIYFSELTANSTSG